MLPAGACAAAAAVLARVAQPSAAPVVDWLQPPWWGTVKKLVCALQEVPSGPAPLSHAPLLLAPRPPTVTVMLLALLALGGAAVLCEEPPSEHPPSSKVAESSRYYTLSVYQNNAGGTFDESFIDMETAEVKKGGWAGGSTHYAAHS